MNTSKSIQQKCITTGKCATKRVSSSKNVCQKKKRLWEKSIHPGNFHSSKVYITKKVYNINVYNKKVLSKNLFNKHVYGLYNKNVCKKDFTKKHVYDNNVYHIKLDKTLSSTTCGYPTQHECNIHLYKKQLSNKILMLTTKMFTKNVHTTKVYIENGLQQKENNKKYTKNCIKQKNL